MNKIKISVVIPVFNAETFLQRCVNSVLSQSYQDFELILVDDGSKDMSGAMCDNIASHDDRVRVIHQNNAGAGAARNVGISVANGEYIVFVDSDDTIRQGYFNSLVQHDEDVVFVNVDNIDCHGKLLKREYMTDFSHLSVDEILRSQMTGKLPWGGVRKCVKRCLIKEKNICYSNHKIGEEAIYSYQVLRHAKSVGFIDQPVYCYMLHDDSLSNARVDDPWGEVAIALRVLIQRQGDYPAYANTLNAFIKTAAAVSIMKMAQHHTYTLFARKAKERIALMNEVIDSDYDTDWKHAPKKARAMVIMAFMQCWPIIWAVCKLRC